MLKPLLAQVKQFRKASLLAPLFTILESILELIIPLLMANLIDYGNNQGNLSVVFR